MTGSVALCAGNGHPVARHPDPHPDPQRMNHTQYSEETESPGICSSQLSVLLCHLLFFLGSVIKSGQEAMEHKAVISISKEPPQLKKNVAENLQLLARDSGPS